MCQNTGLAVVRRPRWTVIAPNSMVMGRAIRPVPPGLGVARVTRAGLTVRVRLHPGQTPEEVEDVCGAMAHAWRVHAVRASSPRRGLVVLSVTARDPLASVPRAPVGPGRVLSAAVGLLETGERWVINFRRVPHWLVVGATQSGKSTWIAALVSELAPQPVALVGLDLKGGLELSLFERRLSALACSRDEAVDLLNALLDEVQRRMAVCRSVGVRSVWELPEDERPVPVVVLVDEVAELYLPDGTPEGRRAVAACTVGLLRLAQLGRALGVHLVVAGQRVGSELGPGVTALRAQLGGRVCHRVTDEQTAEMALGDMQPAAVEAAQMIGMDEPGVAVMALPGRWVRARSVLVTPEEAEAAAARWSHRTPVLTGLHGGAEEVS
jgi:S-DNA-T family DNA segregation ATPase FtsK/SpoIIIE